MQAWDCGDSSWAQGLGVGGLSYKMRNGPGLSFLRTSQAGNQPPGAGAGRGQDVQLFKIKQHLILLFSFVFRHHVDFVTSSSSKGRHEGFFVCICFFRLGKGLKSLGRSELNVGEPDQCSLKFLLALNSEDSLS